MLDKIMIIDSASNPDIMEAPSSPNKNIKISSILTPLISRQTFFNKTLVHLSNNPLISKKDKS